jgi:hypothetical protein
MHSNKSDKVAPEMLKMRVNLGSGRRDLKEGLGSEGIGTICSQKYRRTRRDVRAATITTALKILLQKTAQQ